MENKIIEIANKEIGYIETKGNLTKYGKWFGLDGHMWCGMFVSWVYFMAKNPLPKIGFSKGFASCQFFYEYAKKNKLIVNDPKAGDIVLFDFNNDKRFDHVGIFEEWLNIKTFNTIEGNTSQKNQNNGGMVMRKKRSLTNSIFVRIP
jgi:hypothetical protein